MKHMFFPLCLVLCTASVACGDDDGRDMNVKNNDTDAPTLPSGWTLLDYVTPEELTIQLPNPTINIRTDNEDSFQGPIPQLTSTRVQKLGVFQSVVRVPLRGNTECRYGQRAYS